MGDTNLSRPAGYIFSQPVGILGGMGPAATNDFFRKLIDATPATRDQEHLPVVIWSDPRIPDRTEALLDDGPDPTPWIENGIERLRNAGCRIVAIPCNTAHAFLNDISERFHVDFVDMIAETVQATIAGVPDLRKVGLLATTGTVRSNIYDRAFSPRGVTVLVPEPSEQAALMSVIHAVKSGSPAAQVSASLDAIIQSMALRGVEAVILGCTELPLVVRKHDRVQVVDPTRVLAEAVVARAGRAAHHTVATSQPTPLPSVRKDQRDWGMDDDSSRMLER